MVYGTGVCSQIRHLYKCSALTLSMLVENSENILKYSFLIFSQKTVFDLSCKLSPMCIKC